jgi:site-specific recombinase XerD
MKPTDFSYHLSNYLAKYLPGVRGLSPNTILSYRDAFATLVCFYETVIKIKAEKISVSDFCVDNIVLYLDWLETVRNNRIATRNSRLAAIHTFAKYIGRAMPEKMYPMQEITALPLKKTGTTSPKYLSTDALKLLLSVPDGNSESGRRDATLLALLYDSGARVQELCDLVVSDIRLEPPGTIRLTGKGSKTRIVPLMPPMTALLRRYMEERNFSDPAKGDNPLFTNPCGEKLTRKGISYILKKYYLKAKLSCPELYADTISPHCLRHSKSMHLLQAGVNLIYIRDILGHADIKTTEIYARIDGEMKRKVLEKATLGVASESLPVWHKNKGLLSWLKSLG